MECKGDFINRLHIYRIDDRITIKVAVYGYFFLCLGCKVPVCPAKSRSG